MNKSYTDIEVTKILQALGVLDADVYIDQIVAAGLNITDQPDEGVLISAGELDAIREQVKLDAEDATATLSEWDVIEMTEDNPGYMHDDAGRLALQYEGEFVSYVDSADAATESIADEVGFEVRAKRVTGYFGARWTFEIDN